jgi:hypothetical protein
MVKPIISGLGGYSQGGPVTVYSPGIMAPPQPSRYSDGLTAYPGEFVPTTPDAALATAPTWQVDWTRDTALPGQLTLARSSSATYLGPAQRRISASSNGPRIWYDGYGNPLGLLIEAEQRTNLIWTSETLSIWAGSAAALSAGTAQVGASGTNMSTVTASSGTGTSPLIYQGSQPAVTLTNGVNHLIAWDAKAGTSNYCFIDFSNGVTAQPVDVVFDLTDGSVGQTAVTTGSTLVSTGSMYLGNGIWRIWIVAQLGNQAVGCYCSIGVAKAKTGNPLNAGASPQIAGTFAGTETIIVQCPDLQQGDTYTSHIITSGSASATRSGDILSTTNTDLLGATAWEIETGAVRIASGAAETLIGVNTVTGLGVTSTGAVTTADGGTQTTTDTGTWTGTNRAGLAWTP